MKITGLLLLLLCLAGSSKAQTSADGKRLGDTISITPLPQIHRYSVIQALAIPVPVNPFYQWYCVSHALSLAALDCSLQGILLTIGCIPSYYENEEAYLAEVYRGKSIHVKGKLYTQ